MREFFWDGETISRERSGVAVREGAGDFGRQGFGLWVAEEADRRVLRPLDRGPDAEVLYGIAPSRWGRGFATEAALAMLRYGLEEAGLECILGIADKKNTASRRVLEKIGMSFERYVHNEGREEARYSIRREAFRPSAAPR